MIGIVIERSGCHQELNWMIETNEERDGNEMQSKKEEKTEVGVGTTLPLQWVQTSWGLCAGKCIQISRNIFF